MFAPKFDQGQLSHNGRHTEADRAENSTTADPNELAAQLHATTALPCQIVAEGTMPGDTASSTDFATGSSGDSSGIFS
jgi:hypothetical protein